MWMILMAAAKQGDDDDDNVDNDDDYDADDNDDNDSSELRWHSETLTSVKLDCSIALTLSHTFLCTKSISWCSSPVNSNCYVKVIICPKTLIHKVQQHR